MPSLYYNQVLSLFAVCKHVNIFFIVLSSVIHVIHTFDHDCVARCFCLDILVVCSVIKCCSLLFFFFFLHVFVVNYELMLHTNVKIKIINCITGPAWRYQCQTWTVRRENEMKIMAREMRSLGTEIIATTGDCFRDQDFRCATQGLQVCCTRTSGVL